MIQTIVIIFLSFWAYQEYLYNQYLQDYVNSYFQGSGLLVVILGSIGAFVLVGVVLYSKLRRTRRVLEDSDRAKDDKKDDGSSKILGPQMEQHLIEMMRRTTPADSSGSQQMLVLNRDEPQTSSNQSQ